MKKMFACVLALCPMIASADYLDDKIASLTKEKLDKIAKLEECQKSTKGLKIAGITTLGVSAIGIGANIGEAVKLNKLETQIGTAETTKSNLDKQISAAKEEKAKKEKAAEEEQERQRQAASNTCGIKTCDAAAPTQEGLDLLKATEAVCKDGNWVAKKCKEGYSGTEQRCTLNGETVTYIDSCRSAAPTEKQCPSVTEDWKAQNNAKSGACDTTTGENYITECADTHEPVTNAENRITECKIKEQAQPVVSDRAHHSACTDAEKIDLQSKGADEVWVYKNKCVPKSCKTGWFLVVKGESSQGYCVKTCQGYQQKSWTNGGQACDVEKQKQNCNRKVYGKDEYTSGQCQAKCEEYANESTCNLTGDAVEITLANQCVCNPVRSDVTKSNQVTQENQSGNSALQTVPVQQNDSTTVVVQEVIQPIENKLPGHDMGGGVITYDYSYDNTKFDAIATFVVDGRQYSEVGDFMGVGPSKHEQRLNDKVTKRLQSLGYSNFKISCKGCP